MKDPQSINFREEDSLKLTETMVDIAQWTSTIRQCLLVLGNALMTMGWARVLVELVSLVAFSFDEDSCRKQLYPTVVRALSLSTIELFHCMVGLTRTKSIFVMLFLVVRGGVEYFAGPDGIHDFLSCLHWTHIYTITCWSLGEFIRFGCFTVAEMSKSSLPKSVRYVAGPIAFTLGALGEMLMLKRLADHPNTLPHYNFWILVLICMWPFGFAILMKQLLKQKKKHFDSFNSKEKTKKKT